MEIDGIEYKSAKDICGELGIKKNVFDRIKNRLTYHHDFASEFGDSLIKKVGRSFYYSPVQVEIAKKTYFESKETTREKTKKRDQNKEDTVYKEDLNNIVVQVEDVCQNKSGLGKFSTIEIPMPMIGSKVKEDKEPETLKDVVADFMKSRGWSVSIIENDPYVDIVFIQNTIKTAVRVKSSEEEVDFEEVMKLLSVMDKYNCVASLFVTNNYFSFEAANLARKHQCKLIDKMVLDEWLRIDTQKY